jgi:hypothetical protein
MVATVRWALVGRIVESAVTQFSGIKMRLGGGYPCVSTACGAVTETYV